MRRIPCVLACAAAVVMLSAGVCAADTAPPQKVMLLIAEQNISGPQHAWWASEIDLSSVEAALAAGLISQGYDVSEPADLAEILRKEKAFRAAGISQRSSVRMGRSAQVDFVVKGKAVASAGAPIPQSSMRSCYANVSARLIRVSDGKTLAYVTASGSAAHMDTVTGGREALSSAGKDLAAKIVTALHEEVEVR